MTRELTFHGLAVSPGIATGTAYTIARRTLRVPQYEIAEDYVDAEVARLADAVTRASADIRAVYDVLVEAGKAAEAGIFEPQLLILGDREFLASVEQRIREERANAEDAFHRSALETVRRLEASADPYLSERANDIRDVEYRVLQALLGEREPAIGDLMENAVVVAHDLPASVMAELDRDRIIGFATEIGAANSHMAILARALEIPAVISLGPVLQSIEHGDPISLDGGAGLVILRPKRRTLRKLEKARGTVEKERRHLVEIAHEPAITADGVRLMFQANLEFAVEVDGALEFGCEGVGLYRTEYLFLQAGGDPSEEEQYEVYRGLVERMSGRPVTIRTIDLGGDKLLAGMEGEPNPFLGWRAIRYCLDRPEVFQTQLRAILRAGAVGPVSLLLPMVAAVEEVDRALEHVADARASLERDGIEHAVECPVGVLIETPGSALLAEELARRVDFLSLGTNDLVQYTLAVDRGNRRVGHLFQPLHPAVLRLIDHVCRSVERAGIEVTVCGEMGSGAHAAALLAGFGVRSFSMVPSRIPRVKRALSGIRVADAANVAEIALGMATADDVAELVAEKFGDAIERARAESRG